MGKASVLQAERIIEMDGGNGHQQQCEHTLMPLTCALKMIKTVKFMSCVCTTNKKDIYC